MKIKSALLLLLFLVCFSNKKALSQVLISPMGGFLQNDKISLTFSAGEAFSGDFNTSTLSFSSGFTSIFDGLLTTNEDINPDLPKEFGLSQNYPNPFNPTTNIEFSLPQRSNLKIDVFNSLGMRIAVLVDDDMQAGFHTVRFNASSYSSGIYFYRLIADGNVISTKKMLLIK